MIDVLLFFWRSLNTRILIPKLIDNPQAEKYVYRKFNKCTVYAV